jgi:hypothetical protein
MGNDFIQNLDNIPSSLKILEMGDSFNNVINLNEGLKVLFMGSRFNQNLNFIPDSLEVLILGHAYNKVISISESKNLKHVKLGNLFDQPITFPQSLLILEVLTIVTRKLTLPNGLKQLKLHVNINYIFNELPESLHALSISGRFIKNINGVLSQKLKLPKFLSHLHLRNFDQEIEFNENLTTLSIDSNFLNEKPLIFPNSLHTLDIQGDFSDEVTIPPNLITLKVHNNYKGISSKFPDTLTSLTINGDTLNDSTWPKNLISLRLDGNSQKKITKLPESLLELIIYNSDFNQEITFPDFLENYEREFGPSYKKNLNFYNAPKSAKKMKISSLDNLPIDYPQKLDNLELRFSFKASFLNIPKTVRFLKLKSMFEDGKYNIGDNVEVLKIIANRGIHYSRFYNLILPSTLLSLRIENEKGAVRNRNFYTYPLL